MLSWAESKCGPRRLRSGSECRRDVYVNMCRSCWTLCHMEGSAAPAFVLDGKWTHKERRREKGRKTVGRRRSSRGKKERAL